MFVRFQTDHILLIVFLLFHILSVLMQCITENDLSESLTSKSEIPVLTHKIIKIRSTNVIYTNYKFVQKMLFSITQEISTLFQMFKAYCNNCIHIVII